MAFSQDILTRIIDVHWRGGVFSFAGNIFLTIVTPSTGGSLGQAEPHFTWLGGTSSNGESWTSSKSEEGLALSCCVRGSVGTQSVVVAAGSVITGPFDFGPGYSLNYGEVPAGGVSYDGGQTWSDAGIPLQEHILKPPDPVAGTNADSASGHCQACVYHPGTQTFYVGGSVLFGIGSDFYWEDRLYSGTGIGFSQVYSERRDINDPFTGWRWPEVVVINPTDRLRVADRTMTTNPGPGILFVVSFGPDQQAEYFTTDGKKSFVSVKSDGTAVSLGGKDIFPPMAIVNSVCGGSGHIVAVGWEDEYALTGHVTFVSNDDGESWTEQLSELRNTNPGRDDINAGSSGGSCSFSPTSSSSSRAGL